MTDVVAPEVRSRMMSGIRGKNTRPELLLRKALHRRGFRYRLHQKKLPGHPDIVFPSRRAAIFVHGCFWHRHQNCRYATTPASNRLFWEEKFAGNVKRDARALEALQSDGWRVLVVWECELRGECLESTLSSVAAWLTANS